jgi:hypothetical protein
MLSNARQTSAVRSHRKSLRPRVLLAAPTAAVVLGLIGPPLAAATTVPQPGPAGATTQGIIMRDGGVCDPIRHMGC